MGVSGPLRTAGVTPGSDPRLTQRMMKPDSPCGASSDTSTDSTWAPRGPRRQNSTRRSTPSASPSNTASTVPSHRFAIQPLSPCCCASLLTESRKNTPCTCPWTTRRRRITRRILARWSCGRSSSVAGWCARTGPSRSTAPRSSASSEPYAGSPVVSRRRASQWTISSTGNAGLRRPELRHQLLLVVPGILPRRVVRLDGCRVREAAARVDTEVVADEAPGRADAVGPRRGQLRIPRVRRQPHVVSERLQPRGVELDRRVDAVGHAAVRRPRIELEPGDRCLRRVARRARQAPVVEGDGDAAVGGHGDPRLQRLSLARAVVHQWLPPSNDARMNSFVNPFVPVFSYTAYSG